VWIARGDTLIPLGPGHLRDLALTEAPQDVRNTAEMIRVGVRDQDVSELGATALVEQRPFEQVHISLYARARVQQNALLPCSEQIRVRAGTREGARVQSPHDYHARCPALDVR
jgi:hypothetical protein